MITITSYFKRSNQKNRAPLLRTISSPQPQEERKRQLSLSVSGFLKEMRKGKMVNPAIPKLLLLVSLFCMIAVIMSMFNLPERFSDIQHQQYWEAEETNKNVNTLSKFGEMMIEMLPRDMGFTVFVPSEEAFEHILRLTQNQSFNPQEWDNTYAKVSQVLEFSAVPQKIYAESILVGKEISYVSISGFVLHMTRDMDGALVVNGVHSEKEDISIRKGEIVVHIIEGVLMDREFENSVWLGEDAQGYIS